MNRFITDIDGAERGEMSKYYHHFTKHQVDKYKIMSRETCERYCKQKHKKISIIISIRSSMDRVMPSLPMNETNNVVCEIQILGRIREK